MSAKVPAKYANDLECRKCHVPADTVVATAAAGTGDNHNLIGLACESCHGPALQHVRFNIGHIHGPPLSPPLEQAARDSIRQEKPAANCIRCHIEQNHKEHPPYDEAQSGDT
jgi:hypothetical protein